MKLVFCGTPQFAAPTLDRLIEAGHEVAVVVTQPDRPQGRGMEPAASPVKQSAMRHSLMILQPERIRNNMEFREKMQETGADAIVVVGYGRIIPPWMLELPPFGNINLHASLLPKYRGAAPIQWAIAEGETVTGVTTMLLNEGLDTGDVLLQAEMPIQPQDTAVTLAPRLATVGANLMVETLRGLQEHRIQPVPQDHSGATLAPILSREDGLIEFYRPAQVILNRLRGFQPWPGAYTFFRGKKLAVLMAATTGGDSLDEGKIEIEKARLFVGCGQSSRLELIEVQLEGKKRTSAAEFIHGYHVQSGERFDVSSREQFSSGARRK